MSLEHPKVAIVGAGAIGSLFAGWLGSLPTHSVNLSMVARGDTLQALRKNGLRLVQQETEHVVEVNATDDAENLGVQDLVIVSVKGPSLAQVAPAVNVLLGSHTQVLVAMNGVPWWFFQGFGGECNGLNLSSIDSLGTIAKSIPTTQVVGAVVHASAAMIEPGMVKHVAGNKIIIGLPQNKGTTELNPLTQLLQASGWTVSVSNCIQRDIWYKLWGNMTMNPISALTGATCDRILDDPLVRGFCTAVMLEARTIGDQIGCVIDQEPEARHAVTRQLGAFKTSMLQDVEANRPLEIDVLVSVVQEIGQHLGIATPNTDALLGLVRLMGQSRGLYPLKQEQIS
jgi:2-dehydropantoate 2-reductase